MALLPIIGITAGVIFAFVTSLFVSSIIIKRNDLADIAWGPGIALASYTAWMAAGSPTTLSVLIVLTLTTLWAVRIGIRIFLKNYGKPEDPRYQRWRNEWGQWFYLRSYLQVFLLQGTLMIVLAMSAAAIAVNAPTEAPTAVLIVGVMIWIIGFAFESIADYQLDRFIKNPNKDGQIMRSGLWHYSRHPNYFGEVTMWWGIWLIVAPLPLGLVALVSPLTITFLILYVSGIPLLEQSMKKYNEWAEYKRTTSVFIPLPPKE